MEWAALIAAASAWYLWMLRRTVVSVRATAQPRPWVIVVLCRRRLLERRRNRTLVFQWVNEFRSTFFWADTGGHTTSIAADLAIKRFKRDAVAQERVDAFTGDMEAARKKLVAEIEEIDRQATAGPMTPLITQDQLRRQR